MDTFFYLEKFQAAADRLDKNKLDRQHIEAAVGVVLNSVFLKLYKKSWASPGQDALTAESRIFFSVWVNDATIKDQKLLYNIHAMKLRQLKGYRIQSRKFADNFRDAFRTHDFKWKNVSTDFGPLTLMEGWLDLDLESLEDDIVNLANGFLEIAYLVDNTMILFSESRPN